MKRVAIGVLVAVIVALLVRPEIARYRAEHQLGTANAAFELVLARASEVENAAEVLPRVSERAATATASLPGDSRGWVLAGSCRLVAGDTARALELYRRALAQGERAEIHLNLGRALALLQDVDAARIAFVRSIWISPALLRAVPPGFQDAVSAEITRLESELAAGKLSAPPPPPR
jgi:cytochrome c-type biogenesis protein CcmH/NrfG